VLHSSFAARRTHAAASPDFTVRRFFAVLLSRPLHSRFFELFSAPPSTELLVNRRLTISPANPFYNDCAASG
jgi:hypothetical protein